MVSSRRYVGDADDAPDGVRVDEEVLAVADAGPQFVTTEELTGDGGGHVPQHVTIVYGLGLGLDLDLDRAFAERRESLERVVGKIDHAAVDERSALVDADRHRLPVLDVRHLHDGAERQRAVRGDEAIGLEPGRDARLRTATSLEYCGSLVPTRTM